MTPALTAYLAAWIAACVLAVIIMVKQRRTLSLLDGRYRRYIFVGWKTATFAFAASAMTIMAPYTGDPTWDYFDALFMSVLTFLTAPWAVGTLYLFLHRRVALSKVFVAVCLWMFSASWSYDAYMLLRDGYYPGTWQANIALSSVLYASAGLLWNLQWQEGRGIVFGFMEPGWPDPNAELALRRVIWVALPFMVLVTLVIAPFLI